MKERRKGRKKGEGGMKDGDDGEKGLEESRWVKECDERKEEERKDGDEGEKENGKSGWVKEGEERKKKGGIKDCDKENKENRERK